MRDLLNKMNHWLDTYLYLKGDSDETLLHKKIWWILTMGGFPFLLVMSYMISDKKGSAVLVVNLIFIAAMASALVLFHFRKRSIEEFALFIQLTILILCIVKVYLMGGLLEAGGAVFIGLTAPLYALTLPNKKRAVHMYLVYLFAMVLATELQPETVHDYFQIYYYTGFSLGITIAFAGLYYSSTQVERLKDRERNRLREMDEMKSNFFKHITHELRTPLTIILGLSEQIREDPETELQDRMEKIHRNGKKLLAMTRQLLDLSRLEAKMMPLEPVQGDIIFFLSYLMESYHSLAELKNMELRFTAQEDRVIMDYDPVKVQEIFDNLLSNAIKFTPAGGTVSVRVGRHRNHDKEELVLEVEDNGLGIPAELLPRIFDQYFQARQLKESLSEGTGLGLAITKGLVSLMQGKISVRSELENGTIFQVVIPITNNAFLDNGEPKDITLEEAELLSIDMDELTFESEPQTKNLKLLLVEDNKDVISYMSSLLSDSYAILTASDGAEGLTLALEQVPDLIVSDVMMPKMDGYDLCHKLKGDIRTSHIPVILLTARTEISDKLKGLEAGADVYLGKPFQKQELLLRIKMLIRLRKELQSKFSGLAEDLNFVPDLDNRSDREHSFLISVREVLESHISEEDFGVSQLCLAMGMSRSQLYRKFSALTNSSVYRYIRKIRLNKARELLCSTDLTVTEVAYDTGFKNLSHFSRVYSEEFGVVPSKEKV